MYVTMDDNVHVCMITAICDMCEILWQKELLSKAPRPVGRVDIFED